MPKTLTDVLGAYVRGQEAVRNATAWVQATLDEQVPGRTIYRITGHAKAAVQAAIDNRCRLTEDHEHGGLANFIGPYRSKDGYEARGEVVLFQPEAVS